MKMWCTVQLGEQSKRCLLRRFHLIQYLPQASVHFYTCSDNECNISLIILKVLTEISQMWARMEFSYEEHYRTATPMLKCSDELIESLEESQV